jgi:hypothetical protein
LRQSIVTAKRKRHETFSCSGFAKQTLKPVLLRARFACNLANLCVANDKNLRNSNVAFRWETRNPSCGTGFRVVNAVGSLTVR